MTDSQKFKDIMSDLSPETLFSVKDRVAVVTGGGTGIGLMIATALENNGATVYIIGRRLEVLQKAAKENNKYGKLIPIQGDVSSKESLLAVANRIKEEQGYINLLVANSGVAHSKSAKPHEHNDIKSLQEALWNAGTQEDFNETLAINVTGVYYTIVAFLELLDAGNKRRAIPDLPTSQAVIIGSIGGFRRDELSGNCSYAVSKAAVHHLGKLFVNYLRHHQIRINIIAPGIYASELTLETYKPFIEGSQQIPPTMIPLGRLGTEQDMAATILYLAGKGGAYINGVVLLTDGGRLSLFSSTY